MPEFSYSDAVAAAKARMMNGAAVSAGPREFAVGISDDEPVKPNHDVNPPAADGGGDSHTEGGGTASRRVRQRKKTFSQVVADATQGVDQEGVKPGAPPGQMREKTKVGGDPVSKDQIKRTFFKASGIKHGVVFGWAIKCVEKGKPYFDVQDDCIPEGAMLDAACDFAKAARPGNEMHSGSDSGQFLFLFPMTEEIAKAYGFDTGGDYGLMVGYKPTAKVLEKFEDGSYQGFSIEGVRIKDKAVES